MLATCKCFPLEAGETDEDSVRFGIWRIVLLFSVRHLILLYDEQLHKVAEGEAS